MKVAAGIDTEFGCNGSWAIPTNIVGFLNNFMGYSSNRSSFSWEAVNNELRAHHPVIAEGHNGFLCIDGHYWVIDGLDSWIQYKCEKNPWTGELFETQVASYLHYSMNWGWGGSCNG